MKKSCSLLYASFAVFAFAQEQPVSSSNVIKVPKILIDQGFEEDYKSAFKLNPDLSKDALIRLVKNTPQAFNRNEDLMLKTLQNLISKAAREVGDDSLGAAALAKRELWLKILKESSQAYSTIVAAKAKEAAPKK